MLFYIRFRAQLRRTRPELISVLEETVAVSAVAAGGKVETGRKVLAVSFDEDRTCFWLDLVVFLEKVHKALEKAGDELYGYALALGQDSSDSAVETPLLNICRSLSGDAHRGPAKPGSGKNSRKRPGIWCSDEVRKFLDFYIEFDSPVKAEADDLSGGYRELKAFRSFGWAELAAQQPYPYREKITRNIAQGADKNTVLLGPEFLGKRDGIYHYCAGLLGDVPPLVVRFGAGGRSLICFADAYTSRIRSFIAGTVSTEELDAVHALLFRERLREEWSPYVKERSRSFIRSLLISYTAAAKTLVPAGVLVLEDLGLADTDAAGIFREVYSSLEDKKGLLVLAADSAPEDSLKNWGGFFPRILRFSAEDFSAQEKAGASRLYFLDKNIAKDIFKKLPKDLWEASYNIFLLGRYFPSDLFPKLFEEEGLNRDMYFRALQILNAMGILASDDPRPRIPDFESLAQKALGNKKEKIRSAVRKRILDWAGSGRLRPCFNLLRILSELGEGADDVLVLRSLRADVLNGTCEGIEEALVKGYFASLVGGGNAPALKYIYKTLRVLVLGGSEEIRSIFQEPVPSLTLKDGRPCYGGCRAQVQVNLAAFHIGSKNNEAASEAVRKAMLLNRDLGKDAIPAYRLFSLVNLSRQRIDDALEYITFALEQAERTEQSEELLLTCYFAASIYFLYGNLSKAERLAVRAEGTASELGQSSWGKRARFLRGRLYFEAGRYDEALEIFRSIETETAGFARESAEMAATVKAWIYRTGNFLGRVSIHDAFQSGTYQSEAPMAGLDAGVFEIEAAFFAADYQKAATLADNFLSFHNKGPNTDFLFTEQPDWRSGFSQCEYLFQPGKVPGTRIAWVYRAIAQCSLNLSREAKAEILGGMQRFMREELLPDTDPSDAFFFYAWYCMLRDAKKSGDFQNSGEFGSSQVDMGTVVSMAYKRLQRRAARIDDRELKQAFLTKPHWNKTLCLAAREYKLI